MEMYGTEEQEVKQQSKEDSQIKVQYHPTDFQPEQTLFSFYSSYQQNNRHSDTESQPSVEDFNISDLNIQHRIAYNCVSIKSCINRDDDKEDIQLPSLNLTSTQKSYLGKSLHEQSSIKCVDDDRNMFLEMNSNVSQIQQNDKGNNMTQSSEDINKVQLSQINDKDNIQIDKLQPQKNMLKLQQQLKQEIIYINPYKTLNNNFKSWKETVQEKEIEEDQIKMISKMAASKRKENYIYLGDMQAYHHQIVDFHQSIIQIFLNQIDKRLKSSMANLEIYSTFFQQRAHQQDRYSLSPIISTNNALSQNFLASGIYSEFTSILNNLSKYNQEKRVKIRDFVHLINKNILKDLIECHSIESQKQLLKIRQKISNLKINLKKCSAQVINAYEQINNCRKQGTPKKDIYILQLKLQRKIMKETNIQRQLGSLSLEYYNEAIKQDKIRSQVIKQSLITYSKGLHETYRVGIEQQEIEQMSKDEEQKLIVELYSFQELFQDGQIQLFQKKAQISKNKVVEFEDFQDYLKNFSPRNLDMRMSILKDYNVYLTPKQVKQEVQCYMVITVDSYMHFFNNKLKQQEYIDPYLSIHISKKELEIKLMNRDFIEIIKKQNKVTSMLSYFWDKKNNKSYYVQFMKRDSKEQFMDTIKKLLNQ